MSDQEQVKPLAEDNVVTTKEMRLPPMFDKEAPSITLKGSVSLDFKAVVNRVWIQFWREEAQAEDASPFLKQLQEQHPVNDEAFVEGMLKNGIRHRMQHTLAQLFGSTGLGGTVAPGKVEIMQHVEGANAPVAIQVLRKEEGGHPVQELN